MFLVLKNHLVDYPTPQNLFYLWNFGFLAAMCLVIQIISGVFLAIHYTPNVLLAFYSVEHIMRDVFSGWLMRYIHANGASFFFIVVYIHIARGLYYGSFLKPRQYVWVVGVLLILVMIATAFIGYVLPWGQMSLWGAVVISNLFSAVPVIGDQIVFLLWGGFSVDNATLNRFFSLHYLLPFVIAALTFIHLSLLHEVGSNNQLGVNSIANKLSFFPYFYVKDLFGLIVFLVFFFFFVFFFPNFLGHPDNYIEANPIVTPAHIIPEWYFCAFYAILRSIPDKLGGVLAIFAAILVLLIFPFFLTFVRVRSFLFRPFIKKFYWFFIVNFLILVWLGIREVESPFVRLGQLATFFYFFYFLLVLPMVLFFEDSLMSF